MITRFLLTPLFCLALASSALCQDSNHPEVTDSWEPPKAALDSLHSELIASFSKNDIERLLSHVAPHVVVTWHNGEVSERPDGIRAFYNRLMHGEKRIVKDAKFAPEILGKQVYGDWAIAWGKLHDQFLLTDGTNLPMNSVFTATIAKHENRWLVTGYHVSVNVFENPLQQAVGNIVFRTSVISALFGLLLCYFAMRNSGYKKSA